MTDIEIAQKNKMEPIEKIAEKIGIAQDKLETYGNYKAKITFDNSRGTPCSITQLETSPKPPDAT